jgi:hypothetical protein
MFFLKMLGISETAAMLFNLENIIQSHELSHLDAPFIADEIEKVFKEMPLDKALEPDGFNGLFVKKCWPLIKHDFINLVNDFYIGT